MDELTLLRLQGGLMGGVIDWAAVLLFIAIAVLYYLAPVLGYRPDRRGALAVALFLLVGYAALSVIQQFVFYMKFVDPRPQSRPQDPMAEMHQHFLFAMLKLGSFVLAMLVFVLGLLSLRQRRPGDLRDEENPFDLRQTGQERQR
jgi:hypothetical protein